LRQQILTEVAENHTTLVIAHRLPTVVDADHILVMAGGRIREQGTHHRLLEQQGVYAEMWELQRRERDIPSARIHCDERVPRNRNRSTDKE